MRPKSTWAVQSFLTCFIANALMIAVFYMVAKQVIEGLQQWVDPFLQPGAQNLPQDVRSAFSSLKQFLTESQRYLQPIVLGLGGLVTFVLWLIVHLQGRGLAKRIAQVAAGSPLPTASPEKDEIREAGVRDLPAQGPPVAATPSPQPAIQILSLLQRQGRFIDFLQEDLTIYDDTQIGAAVRSIHQGCREALMSHMELKPIFEDAEGAPVTIAPGFDPKSIRLTGNVSGNPPFSGTLRHRGWRVERVELPQATSEQRKDWVLAPAEVEIQG